MTIQFQNQILEDFYQQDCNNNQESFIEKITALIENAKIKSSIKQGLKEAKLQNSGQLQKRELKDILNEI